MTIDSEGENTRNEVLCSRGGGSRMDAVIIGETGGAYHEQNRIPLLDVQLSGTGPRPPSF